MQTEWEDILHDYLEVAWKFGKSGAKSVVKSLREERIKADSIASHRCVQVQSHLLCLKPESKLSHIWLLDETGKKLKKIALNGRG